MKNLTLENLTKVCGGVYSGPSDKLEQEVSELLDEIKQLRKEQAERGLEEKIEKIGSGRFSRFRFPPRGGFLGACPGKKRPNPRSSPR